MIIDEHVKLNYNMTESRWPKKKGRGREGGNTVSTCIDRKNKVTIFTLM